MSGAAFLEGTIVSVVEQPAATELAADASIGASEIFVVDADELDLEGGTITITDQATDAVETIDYLSADAETGEVVLDGTLAAAAATGDVVAVDPESVERLAYVLGVDQDEEVEARVPHTLYDRLATGIRDPDDEPETVRIALEDDEYVVTDVLDRPPLVDAAFIDEETIPGSPVGSDGIPPASSPTPNVVGGPASLFVLWDGISNNDPVTYEVHISTSSGFTPDSSTLIEETPGTMSVLRTLGDGSTALVAGTTYYVKLIAKDVDGSAAASSQDSGTPALIDAETLLIAETVVADLILADTALFDKLNALLVIANTLATATSGARWEADADGMRLYDSGGNILVELPTDGSDPQFTGHLDALGLDLEAGTSTTPADDQKVRWLRASDADLVAVLLAYETVGGTRSAHFRGEALVNELCEVVLEAKNSDDTAEASLTLQINDSGDFASAAVGVGDEAVTLYTSGDQSSFVKNPLGDTQDRAIARGAASITTGASPNATSSAIAHGLGSTPTAVIATVVNDAGTGTRNEIASVGAIGSSTFTITIQNRQGSNIGSGTATVKWIAMT